MKKIALALLCVFATGSTAAQTYACQFIMEAGMIKDPKGSWRTTSFKLNEPFFLTMSNGLIDKTSLDEPPINMYSRAISCLKYELAGMGIVHWCADYANYLSLSEKTLNGGLAKTYGALQSPIEDPQDSVTVSRFKCQKVR